MLLEVVTPTPPAFASLRRATLPLQGRVKDREFGLRHEQDRHRVRHGRASNAPEAGPARVARADGGGGRGASTSAAQSARRRSAASSISISARSATRPCCSTTCPAIRAATACSRTSSPRCGASISRWAMIADGSEMELVRFWRRYMKEAEVDSAGHAADRRAAGERERGQRHRPVQDSRAEMARARRRLLHRHRLHGGHARSRHRLDQLRRLPRAGARQDSSRRVMCSKGKHGDMIQKQISPARRAVPDRGGVRHASGAVHDRRPRNSLRQERIRRGGRTARRSRSK